MIIFVFVIIAIDMLFPECINWALRKLEETISKNPDRPASWGNTNLKPRDYLPAIELAERSGRPVQFVRSGFELEPVTLNDLLIRNMKRFFRTGRYIPATVLERTLETSRSMLQEQFLTPESLCNAVGYILDENRGTVIRRQNGEKSQPLQQDQKGFL